MKERPILFSGPMVRAILEDRKAQTRRVVKPQPVYNGRIKGYEWNARGQWGYEPVNCIDILCPYGQPGDRLWVRETWCNVNKPHLKPDIYYHADTPDCYDPTEWKCKPSIHMPRWASRIDLEITKIRVERVQEISELDAKAEGCFATWDDHPKQNRDIFHQLWDSINGKKHPWESNPWVWVIEFKRQRA